MKYIFTIINIVIVTMLAYFCVEIIYKRLTPNNIVFEKDASKIISDTVNSKQAIHTMNRSQIPIILKRNLFGVDIEQPKKSQTKQKTKDKVPDEVLPTNLSLKLWGTVTGGSEIYAVIEDKKSRKQSLFQVGDSIDGAKVKTILRNKVILFYKGKNQVLEMQTDYKNEPSSKRDLKKSFQDKKETNNVISSEPIIDTKRMASQIKFRPHFTNGQPDGLMVYGIKSNSVFKKMGLRNGDIIKDINETPIVSDEDVSLLFSEIEQTNNIKLTLLRRGKIKKLLYQATENNDKGDQ